MTNETFRIAAQTLAAMAEQQRTDWTAAVEYLTTLNLQPAQTVAVIKVLARFRKADHNCLDHLQWHECDSTESSGETWHDEWADCGLCGAKYTPEEIREINEQENQ